MIMSEHEKMRERDAHARDQRLYPSMRGFSDDGPKVPSTPEGKLRAWHHEERSKMSVRHATERTKLKDQHSHERGLSQMSSRPLPADLIKRHKDEQTSLNGRHADERDALEHKHLTERDRLRGGK
jgi:hypothetical protein